MESFRIRSFIGTHDKDWEDKQVFSHESREITIVLEGSGYFRSEGKQVAINAGQVVLIPSFIPHSFHAMTPIRFGVLLIDGLPVRIQPFFDQQINNGHPTIITFSRMDHEQYEILFRQWLRVISSSLKEPERTYSAWVEMLLLFIDEHSHFDQQALSIAHIADFIRQNIQHGFQISDLSELAGLTEDGLRKQFFKVYEVTPKQYQQKCRLTEAKWLLSSSDKDLQSIAELVGFPQIHHFSSWFKKLEGNAPSEWRKKQRMYHN